MLTEGERETLKDGLGDKLGLRDGDKEPDRDGLKDGDNDPDKDGDREGLRDGDKLGLGEIANAPIKAHTAVVLVPVLTYKFIPVLSNSLKKAPCLKPE